MSKGKLAFGREPPPPKPRTRGRKRPGKFLGGIFGEGSKSGPGSFSSTNSNTTTQIDPGGQYTPLQESVLGVGQGLLNKEYQPYDPNQRFADFTPDQLAAQQGVRNAQGAWQGNFNQAQGALNLGQSTAAGVGTAGQTAFNTAGSAPGGIGAAQPYATAASGSWTDPGTADKWMNPFTKNVTDATVQQAQEAFSGVGGIKQGITDMFTGGGGAQFGRERMGDVASKATADWTRGLTQSLGAINAGGYNQGMTAFGNEQQRQAGLAGTMGQLGVGDVTSQTALGTAQTNAQATAARSNIEAGQAQAKMGQDLSGAMYKDASALGTSGATQQQQEQQKKDFAYQQNREQFDWDRQRAAQAQGLAQGWQLPTTTSSQSYGNQGTTQPTGSVAGNVLGAATAIGGMSTGKDTTVAGDVGGWLGKQFSAEGGPIRAAHGGHLAFGPGGQVPVTRAVRARAQRRQPAIMARLQAMGGPGITPGQTPGMMPPKPAFASGGHLPASFRRYHPMWQEDQSSFAFGGPVGFAQGGSLRAAEDFIPVGGPGAMPRRSDLVDAGVLAPPQIAPSTAFGSDFGSANGATGSGGDLTGGVSGTGGVGGSASDSAGGSAAAGTSGDAGSDGSGTYAFGGPTGYDDGGPTGYGFDSLSPAEQKYIRRLQIQEQNAIRAGHTPDQTATDKLTARRQADFEERLRGGEHEAAYAANPGGWWNNFGRGALRGAMSPAVLAGVPGSINQLAFGDRNKWPTMTDVGNFLDRGTGYDSGAAGGREGNVLGNITTGLYGLGSGGAQNAIQWLHKLGKVGALGERVFRYGQPPVGVASAFGD